LTDALLASLNQALDNQELVKVKLHAHKEEKKQLAPELAQRTGSVLVQRVGHVVVLYRQPSDPAKRKIQVPARDNPTIL
jgi:RNA-binding protein